MSTLCSSAATRKIQSRSISERGSILVALVMALVVVQLTVVGVVLLGSRQQEIAVLQLQASQALYAADAGVAMALQEIYDGVDYDGDGGIGTISNDGNPANDPAIGGGQVVVVPLAATTGQKFSVQARVGNVQRQFELWLTTGNPPIEGFEPYAVGVALNNVGGWAPWDSNPGAVAYATNVRARTGAMCVDVQNPSDNVHQYTPTSGQWTYTAWQYIPSTASGADTYFILMNTYASGGGKSWSTQVHFNLGSNVLYDDLVGGVTGNQLSIVRDQWVPIVVNIDLDAGTQTVTYNGALLFSASWNRLGGSRTFAAVDLFGSTIDHVYYDDIQLTQVGAGRPVVTELIEVAPGS